MKLTFKLFNHYFHLVPVSEIEKPKKVNNPKGINQYTKKKSKKDIRVREIGGEVRYI